MTKPGFIAPATPGWWVRTNRIGTNKTGYDWEITAAGSRPSLGSANGNYGWTGSAVGLSRFVTFDAVGAGGHGTTSANFNHTATAGAYVILEIATDSIDTTTATYNSVAMTQLAAIGHNNNSAYPNGWSVRFGIANVAGGTKTVNVSIPSGTTWFLANTVSYTNVGSVGATTSVFGSGTSLSQGPITCPVGTMVVQSFGQGTGVSAFTSLSGGTSRYNQYNLDGQGVGLTIMDSAATATFTASMGNAPWGGMATVLNHP